MAPLLMNMLLLFVGAGLGTAAGWWIRGARVNDGDAGPEDGTQTAANSTGIDKVEGLMARLHQLTATVAADVGEHNIQVQQINEELSSATGDATSVVSIVEKLISINEKMGEQLQVAEDRLQTQADEIQSHVHEARTDALTSLFNRRGFDDELASSVESANQSGRPVSLLMMDVDFFKKFNDTYGHQAGDEVLKTVARVIRTNLSDRAIVCRYGGEEFAVLFPGSDIEAAKRGAERARIAVGQEIVTFDGLDLRVTMSVGMSELMPGEQSMLFVKRADQALYASKSAGRDCSHWNDGTDCYPVTPKRTRPQPTGSSEVTKQPAEDTETGLGEETIEGISTREYFCRDLDRRIGEWRRGGATASVILMEIDSYRQIVDERGENAARVVLRAASQFLKATVRDMDHLARYSCGTFALLLPTASIENAERVAERLRRAVERCELELDEDQVRFTVSLGVSELSKGDERDALLGRVESALAKARAAAGNEVCATTSEEAALASAASD